MVNVYIRTGKSQVVIGKSAISMAMFNSYVKFPEGVVYDTQMSHEQTTLVN